jgi:putative membrane protein
MLFWWVLLKPTTQDHVHYGLAIPYLFTTVLHSGVLRALMTFSSQPWYPYYAPLVGSWGLTPLQDQQLAGLIMWIPGGAVFSLLTIGYFAAWLRALEQRSIRLQQRDALRTR